MSYGILEEIRSFIAEIKGLYGDEFNKLSEAFKEAKSDKDNPVPIYFWKSRLKNAESAFLKAKRKGRPYNTLTDFGGVRLLCLFESDMVKVHDYLLWLYKELEYDLYECIIYNFDRKSDLYFDLKKSEDEHFPGHFLSSDSKMSGYKSIHYLVYTRNDLYIEIQLRTLVQDVWCELEHALSYKNGGAHPHIKKSFALLAKDLENVDDMLSYLKDLDQKEFAAKVYSDERGRPDVYFEYEDELLPEMFSGNDELGKMYKEYRILVDAAVNEMDDKSYAAARTCYQKIDSLIKKKKYSDPLFDYWLAMEDAFLLYGELAYVKAMERYNEVQLKYPDRYCIYYRMGQIHLVREEVADALSSFGVATKILEDRGCGDVHNQYGIRTLLAYIYWQLGPQYIDISFAEIEEAENVYKEDAKKGESSVLNSSHYFELVNNLVWYGLERYIVSNKDKVDPKKRVEADRYYAYVVRKLKDLEGMVENPKYSQKAYEAYDTLAWYYYQKYRRTKKQEFLELAREYAEKMGNDSAKLKNLNIVNLKIRHIQEIKQEIIEVLKLQSQKTKYTR
jgi:ppGpp synthetase/RelA/SpoT-type nucleotidyltranferase